MMAEFARWTGGYGEDHRLDLSLENRKLHESI